MAGHRPTINTHFTYHDAASANEQNIMKYLCGGWAIMPSYYRRFVHSIQYHIAHTHTHLRLTERTTSVYMGLYSLLAVAHSLSRAYVWFATFGLCSTWNGNIGRNGICKGVCSLDSNIIQKCLRFSLAWYVEREKRKKNDELVHSVHYFLFSSTSKIDRWIDR